MRKNGNLYATTDTEWIKKADIVSRRIFHLIEEERHIKKGDEIIIVAPIVRFGGFLRLLI